MASKLNLPRIPRGLPKRFLKEGWPGLASVSQSPVARSHSLPCFWRQGCQPWPPSFRILQWFELDMSLLLLFWPTFTEASKNHSFMCENISPAREFPSVSVMKCLVLSSGQPHFGTWLCFRTGRSLSSQRCCEGSSFKRAWLLSRRGSLMLLHLRHFFFSFRISLQD